MTSSWELCGRIGHASITQIAISPLFTSDRIVVAVSPAGLHISHDGGEHWFTPGRGVVGPFIHDIVVACDGVMLATAPGGLFVSGDGGRSWDRTSPPEQLGSVAFLKDDGFIASAESSGAIWLGDFPTGSLRRIADMAQPATQLLVVGGLLVAVANSLFHSLDDGLSWERICLPGHAEIETTCLMSGGLAVADVDGGLWRLHAGQSPATRIASFEQPLTAIAASSDGSFVVASTGDQIAVSLDAGSTWSMQLVGDSILSLGIAPNGGRMFAGLAGGGVLFSDDLGASWRRSVLEDGAVVVRLEQHQSGMHATLAERVKLWSGDLKEWRLAAPEEPGSDTLDGEDLPFSDALEIVDTVVSNDPHGRSIAIAVRSSDGDCSVWLKAGNATWRKVISHPVTAASIRIVMIGGPRGLFAAIGDSVYRPARIGAALYAREVVDPGRRVEVLTLNGVSDQFGRRSLVVLTSAGIYASSDNGMNWRALPNPVGPPVTAIALVDQSSQLSVLVAQLGGRLLSLSYRSGPA